MEIASIIPHICEFCYPVTERCVLYKRCISCYTTAMGGMDVNQQQRRKYLIDALLQEQSQYQEIRVPDDEPSRRSLLRALMNVRPAAPVSPEFAGVQDEYLRQEIREKGITDVADLEPVADGLYLWQGDITTLRCDAIVNAANSGMTGCYCPNHGCIDNAIHTFAGVQLRSECAALMDAQGYDEPTGRAKITRAYNLPCRYVLHTVGPIVRGELTERDCRLLESCYRACLRLADEHGLRHIAFCCISTGEFCFPNRAAAQIAVSTVRQYRAETNSRIEVIFNVFKDIDLQLYRELLTGVE